MNQDAEVQLEVEEEELPCAKLPVTADKKDRLQDSGNKSSDFNVNKAAMGGPHHSALEKIGTQPSNLMGTHATLMCKPALIRATSSGFQNLNPHNQSSAPISHGGGPTPMAQMPSNSFLSQPLSNKNPQGGGTGQPGGLVDPQSVHNTAAYQLELQM